MALSVALSLKDKKKKRSKFFIILFLFVVLLLSCLIFFLFSYFNSGKKYVSNNIVPSVSSLVKTINQTLEADIDSLNVISNLIQDNHELVSLENISTFLSNVNNSSFTSIAYLNKNGSGYSYDFLGKTLASVDYSEYVCFNNALSMESCFYVDFDKNIATFAVPVYNLKNEILGVVVGIKPKNFFNNQLKNFKLPYSSNLFLVNSTGEIISYNVPNDISPISIFDLSYANIFRKDLLSHNSNKIFKYWANGNLKYVVVTNLLFSDYKLVAIFYNYDIKSIYDFKFLQALKSTIYQHVNTNFIVMLVFILLSITLPIFFVYLSINIYKKITDDTMKSTVKWAFYDEITGGFNKSKFFLEVSKTFLDAQFDSKYALIVMNIDNFKRINNIYDTLKGNQVLKDIFETIKWFLEQNGFCARIMSDYFAILIKYDSDDVIINLLSNITRAINEYKLSVKLYPKFGIYKVTDYNQEVQSMLDRALIAEKSIVNYSVTNYAFFSSDLISDINKVSEFENEMYFALNQNQFIFCLQPIFNTFTGEVVRAEAFARWNHSTKGFLLPSDFINIFEKNAFITYLDQYIIEQVCKLINKWVSSGFKTIPISINVSGLSLSNPRFAEMMLSMVEMYNIPPNLISFDIKEDVILNDIKIFENIINILQKKGFGINLDNFGKASSSLTLLNDIHFDIINLDINFVHNLMKTDKGKNIILELKNLITTIGSKSNMIGVESDYALDFVKSAQFDFYQGYISSRPLRVNDFEDFVFEKTIKNNENIANSINLDEDLKND